MIEEKTFDSVKLSILNEYSRLQKERGGVDYIANVNDDEHLIIEACAYYILKQHALLRHTYENMFIQNATGDNLTLIARNYFGIDRLSGTYPTTEVSIKLQEQPAIREIVFPMNMTLRNEAGELARLRDELVIEAGAKGSSSGILELREYVEESETRMTLLEYNLPYAYEIEHGEFKGGGGVESDDELRLRAIRAQHVPSTAGSVASFIYHAKTSDRRIKDVLVHSPSSCRVEVYYYALEEQMDDAMQSRLEDKLQSDEIKPAGTELVVSPATIVKYDLDIEVDLSNKQALDLPRYEELIAERLREELVVNAKIGQALPHYKVFSIIARAGSFRDVELTIKKGRLNSGNNNGDNNDDDDETDYEVEAEQTLDCEYNEVLVLGTVVRPFKLRSSIEGSVTDIGEIEENQENEGDADE